MTFSPEIIQLGAMLDDRDSEVAVNVMAQLLAREEDLGDLPAVLQESGDPLVRRRAHLLQNALAMRRRRRMIHSMLNDPEECELFPALIELHLLWFDKDQPDAIRRDVRNFLETADKHPLASLEDAEMFMRKSCFLPETESTIRPESCCIGTVLCQHCGSTGLLMAMISELLGRENFPLVRVLGEFGVTDSAGRLLLGGGSWRLIPPSGAKMEKWTAQMMLRYLGTTLLSCAVNSDSYRYVMSITQALTGDESEHVFDGFPYPFLSNPDDRPDAEV